MKKFLKKFLFLAIPVFAAILAAQQATYNEATGRSSTSLLKSIGQTTPTAWSITMANGTFSISTIRLAICGGT